MKGKITIALLSMVAFLGILPAFAQPFDHQVSTVNNLQTPQIDWSQCNPKCYGFIPTHGGTANQIDLSRNTMFDIVMPDGAKKGGVILVPTDFKQMQNNIVVAWLGNFVPTDSPQNIDYCELAQWTWNHQDDKFRAKYNMTLVVPEYCQHGHIPAIPEFGAVAAVALTISVGCIVFLNRSTPKI